MLVVYQGHINPDSWSLIEDKKVIETSSAQCQSIIEMVSEL